MEALDCGRERTRRKRLLIAGPGVVNNPCSMAFLRHVRNQPGHCEYLVPLLKERHRHAFLMTMTAAVRLTWLYLPVQLFCGGSPRESVYARHYAVHTAPYRPDR